MTEHESAAGGPKSGAVVLFTGFSGSGKSTVADALAAELENRKPGSVTALDGDEVRLKLSPDLGFDRESRSQNIRRIGYVASIVSRYGGFAIAAPIAPFRDDRDDVRRQALEVGAFVLVHISTPLDVCESRDPKGLYARARAGDIPLFTGISSPYEIPDDADVTIDTSQVSVEDAVALVIDALVRRGTLAAS